MRPEECLENKTALILTKYVSERLVIRDALLRLGFEQVLEAGDGDGAWALINDNVIHMIIADYNVPLLSGGDLLQRVRGADALAATPFIIIMDPTDIPHLPELLKNNVSAYLVKPFSGDVLSVKVLELFQS